MNNGSMKSIFNKAWDKLGICASTLCILHCLSTPLVLLFFPLAHTEAAETHHIHEIFAMVIIPIILMAVYPTCRRHGHKDIIALAVIGTIAIILGIILHDAPLFFGEISTVIGSILLISAHIKNMKVRHGKCSSHSH